GWAMYQAEHDGALSIASHDLAAHERPRIIIRLGLIGLVARIGSGRVRIVDGVRPFTEVSLAHFGRRHGKNGLVGCARGAIRFKVHKEVALLAVRPKRRQEFYRAADVTSCIVLEVEWTIGHTKLSRIQSGIPVEPIAAPV